MQTLADPNDWKDHLIDKLGQRQERTKNSEDHREDIRKQCAFELSGFRKEMLLDGPLSE